tara:strand:+ start:50 stop:754 length:705 start_codon:yes stop_codon:yes gene_type:complete
MAEEVFLEAYLFISPKKIILSIFNERSRENLFEDEIKIDDNIKLIDLENLRLFLDKNIFEAEKLLKKFIKNIYLIIESDSFFYTSISVKKNFQKSLLSKDKLIHLLNETKDICKNTLAEKKIIHMIIEKYRLDNEHYYEIPQNKKFENISIEVKFICISENIVKNLEDILKQFHISVKNIVSFNYLEKFLKDEKYDLYEMTKKILEGYNENEVFIVNKTNKNKGFFEKFFNLFG